MNIYGLSSICRLIGKKEITSEIVGTYSRVPGTRCQRLGRGLNSLLSLQYFHR